MRNLVVLLCFIAYLGVHQSFAFLAASGKPLPIPAAATSRAPATGDRHSAYSRNRHATATQRRPSCAGGKAACDMISSAWLRKAASAAVAVSVLVGASATAPAAVAAAAQSPNQEPVVQALVQLPDEEADWTK